MFDLEQLSVDPVKASEGVFIDYYAGSQLRVARANNKEAEDYRMQKAIEHADIFNAGGEEADRLAFRVENEVIAHFILKDWKGIKLGGKEAKYTPEAALTLLSDPRYTDFRDDVLRLARNRQHYKDSSEAKAVKVVKETAAS